MGLLSYRNERWSIDIGSYSTRMICNGELVLNEPSVVYKPNNNQEGDQCQFAGESRESYYRKCVCEFPIWNGKVANHDDLRFMLNYFLRKRLKRKSKIRLLRVVFPYYYNAIETKALVESCRTIARKVVTVSSPIAAATGLGLGDADETPVCIINVGMDVTEVFLFFKGEIIAYDVCKNGLINSIVRHFAMKEYSLILYHSQLDEIKIALSKHSEFDISGRDLMSGVPKSVTMQSALLEPYYSETPPQREWIYGDIINTITKCLETAPEDVALKCKEEGLFLIGGNSKTMGLRNAIEKHINCKIRTVDDPQLVVIRGVDKLGQK